jgi:myo-inositol-1(or 4)-monophosphatase
VDENDLLEVLNEAVAAVRRALDQVTDWGLSGKKPGQYHLDVSADEAAIEVLEKADVGILSEETGLRHPERELWVALDPVDGSTNASRHLPWYATSICVLDGEGPRMALVVNQATGDRYEAVRGGGATLNGASIAPTDCTTLADAVVGVTSCPPEPIGYRQVRALGAAALDICCVAAGSLDAYIDFSRSSHGPWDYLAGILVCTEAGAHVAEASGRDFVTRDSQERRAPVVAATGALLDEALAVRAAACS